jgi:MFS family permease
MTALEEDSPLWTLYALAAAASAFIGIDSPARAAAIPKLLPSSQLASAMALNQVLMQVSDVAGPAVGGILIARVGLAWAYGADLITFVAALLALLAMRPMPPASSDVTAARGFASVREGFAYLRGRRVLQTVFVSDLIAMIFGMPRAVFPVLALTVFGVGATGLGLMYAAPAAGALLGALLTGWVRHVRHQGRAVLWAVAAWGVAIIGFGLSTQAFWLALGFLAIAGAADVVSAIFRSTILQSSSRPAPWRSWYRPRSRCCREASRRSSASWR